MHDYKYRTLCSGDPSCDGVPMNVRSDCLRDVVNAFYANRYRICGFSVMPAMIAGSVRRDQLWIDYIEQDAHGKFDPDFYKFLAKGPPPGLSEKLIEMRDAFNKKHPDATEVIKTIATIGINYVDAMLKTHIAMQESIDALMSTIVLESWMTFESLTADLWVSLIDNGPSAIASRVALSKKLLKPDERIKPDDLQQLEYDPRKALGSWLREVGRVSFQKLDYIRDYYSEALGEATNTLFDDTSGGYIFALSAYRNALTHNASKADKHFVKRVERFPELRGIAVSDLLMLDGELVNKLRDAAVLLGTKLIETVDAAITPP